MRNVLEKTPCVASVAGTTRQGVSSAPQPYLPLIQTGILDGAVRLIKGLKGVAHILVPQPGLLLIGNAEQLPHLLLNGVFSKEKQTFLLLSVWEKTE